MTGSRIRALTSLRTAEAGDHEALVHMSGASFGTMMAGQPHGGFTHHRESRRFHRSRRCRHRCYS